MDVGVSLLFTEAKGAAGVAGAAIRIQVDTAGAVDAEGAGDRAHVVHAQAVLR
jgi:hypothetical protein